MKLPNGQDIEIPVERLSGDALQDLEIGIRPEFVKVVETVQGSASTDSNLITWQSTVTLVEALGGETLVYVKLGDAEITLKLPDRDDIVEGSTIELAFNLDQAHLFKASNGDLLSHGIKL